MREALKDPVVAQQSADVGNGLAACLQATSRAEAEAVAPAVMPEPTVMDCLQRVELRVGTVIEADRVPKSNKLLRLMIDLGEPAPRQILAGLGKSFTPEEMVGRRLVVVANLPPIKMMGLESCGMVLAAGDADMLSVFQPTGVPANGTRLK
jgi:methionyl-tRNA synthetase